MRIKCSSRRTRPAIQRVAAAALVTLLVAASSTTARATSAASAQLARTAAPAHSRGTTVPARPVSAATAVSTITLPNGSRHTLVTPAGLRVSLYATGLPSARFMARGPHGDVFVGSWTAGTVSVLLNRAGGPRASRVVTLLSGLTVPHSVVYHNGRLYVAEEGRIASYAYDAVHVRLSDARTVIPSLPTGGRHLTRTVAFGPDGMLYVSIGSSCNECVDAPTRAVIMRYRPDGTGGQVYARGLRNAVGLAWQPSTGRLWAADNGRDLLGENLPPDEIDLIRQGGNYGWPYCWDDGQPDPAVAPPSPGYCASTIPPVVALPAHSAPLGVAFVTGTLLPAAYRGNLVVAYHGSTYRSVPSGYKVVTIPAQGTRAGTPRDLVTGWLPEGAGYGAVWGRPVGVLVAADGSLLISDDLAGVVYRLAPSGR